MRLGRERRSIGMKGWCVVLLCLAVAGCGGGTRSKQRKEVILRSEDVDRKVGKDSSVDVRAQLGLIEDPLLTAYVNAVGQRLAQHAPRRRFKYTFQIVDQEAPNAFALPGGFIFVSRGLLTLTNTEDELAGVLGHEIVHVASRHAAARQELMRGPLSFLQGAYLAGYNRDQEREADRLGQGLAALAGYDPNGLTSFLRDLEHTERLKLGASRLPGFWDTHPSTSRRVAEAAGRSRMVSGERKPAISGTRGDYLKRFNGLAIGPRASEGVFVGDRFLHAELDLAIRFPAGWELRNTHVAVGAYPKRRDAQIFLEHQGPGQDVEAAASEHLTELSEAGFRLTESQHLTVADLDAFRVQGTLPGVRAMITYIHRDGGIFRFTAVAPSPVFDRYKGTMLNVPRSLRSLKPGERRKIREMRLRVATGLGGEPIAALSERTGNRWTVQETAVMNDFAIDRVLEAGELVKIAVLEGY
jgi:predicted Zn-dependent protease